MLPEMSTSATSGAGRVRRRWRGRSTISPPWRALARSSARRSIREPAAAGRLRRVSSGSNSAPSCGSSRLAAFHSSVVMLSKSALRSASAADQLICASISTRSTGGVSCGSRCDLNSASASRRFSGGGGGEPPCFSLTCGSSIRIIWPSRSGSFQNTWKAWSNSARCSARSTRQQCSVA